MPMLLCVEVNDAMQELTGIKYETSEQHKETANARQARDVKNTLQFLCYLKERNSFSSDLSSHDIGHGVVEMFLSMYSRNRNRQSHLE